MQTVAIPPSRETDRALFDATLRRVKKDLDSALMTFFEKERTAAEASREVAFLAHSISDLTLRGGKRFRAALCAIAFEGFGGGDFQRCMPALVGLELLQVYFLVHDDFMDNDDTRRGGLSVPAMLRKEFGAGAFADSTAILAGDYAAALAHRAVAETSSRSIARACVHFAQISRDVIFGQVLDTRSDDSGGAESALMPSDVERTYLLKTGAYTVRGPLELGAILAGAEGEAFDAIARFADPLGIAFQLADDLLSLFGDEASTGKPLHGDLRAGKHTWIIASAIADANVRTAMQGVFGQASATADQTTRLARALVDSGAKARAEARLHSLANDARTELARLAMSTDTKRALGGAITALTERAS